MENTIKIKVKGMHCKSCEMLIKDTFEDRGIKVNFNGDMATLKGDVSRDDAIKIIKEEGYDSE